MFLILRCRKAMISAVLKRSTMTGGNNYDFPWVTPTMYIKCSCKMANPFHHPNKIRQSQHILSTIVLSLSNTVEVCPTHTDKFVFFPLFPCLQNHLGIQPKLHCINLDILRLYKNLIKNVSTNAYNPSNLLQIWHIILQHPWKNSYELSHYQFNKFHSLFTESIENANTAWINLPSITVQSKSLTWKWPI